MSKNLVIVESPAKAKTIEKFLGPDFHVLSSQGHIRDIEGAGKKSIGIDFENGYQPNYVIDRDKEQLLEQLKKEANKADTVWLASDEDREGEAIAWHLQEVLKLDPKHTHRIVFHEITKSAIQKAIEEPRDINYDLVNAQQARRVLDRIVGFELSPILWRKIATGLSAGRVQSVAVRLIVEREREIEEFKMTDQYRILADFTGRNPGDASILHTELNHRFSSKREAMKFLEACQKATFRVEQVTKKPGTRMPAPPFTTSSLQQEAARKLKFSVSKTMRLAQSLYEAGRITYMRTDSVNLSTLAIATAKEEILGEYGKNYHRARQFQTHSKGAQEAHEAIRPTYMNVHVAGANADEQKLYELIWKRTIASQMADAEVETTRVEVSISDSKYLFIASGEIVVFDGFMRAYVQSTDDEQENPIQVIPMMAEREQLRLQEMNAQQQFAHLPMRYSEASLVKKMEELGIGRPSTYATIIETIQQRKYVERGSVPGKKREYNLITLKGGKISDKQKLEMYGADPQKLLPTDLGRIANDFLVQQFPTILDYNFTATEEENFDKIAAGKANWVKTVDHFYHTFHPLTEQVPGGKLPGRSLGVDKASGEPVIAKITKLGPCIQIGDSEDEKPKFASLKRGQSLFTITLDEALDLFKHSLPYTLGEIDGEEVVVGEGKYGPYLRFKGEFISIPKSIDPMAITEEQAQQLIAEKEQKQEPIHVWGDIQVLNGRYGPYLKKGESNYRIPKSVDAAKMTEKDALTLIEKANSAQTKPQNTTFRRKNKK
ncbi:MAG: type I DNA topoisomerase [Paludibacteraceae bacterium]|nr:type I DNA topoisomerase [Paludibacteraceae bacterium]